MKFVRLTLMGAISILFCGVLSFNISEKAEASGYFPIKSYHTYTPRSWRGTYKTGNGSIMKVNTYSVSYNGKTFYKSSWSGWHKLAFAKVDSKNYTFNALAKYGYQSSRRCTLNTKMGRKNSLICRLWVA